MFEEYIVFILVISICIGYLSYKLWIRRIKQLIKEEIKKEEHNKKPNNRGKLKNVRRRSH